MGCGGGRHGASLLCARSAVHENVSGGNVGADV